jgi:Family of unknown function (DUF5343)
MSSTPENGGDKQAIPPYLSHKTFNNFIEGLGKGIPARIDRSVMATLSGTAQAHLLHALRYLNLIDADGVPTERLNQLVSAQQDAEKQRILKEILTSAYPFVFSSGIDLQRCTSRQLEEAFGKTGASSETLRKTLSFFLATAKQAGLALSPHIKRARRPRGTGLKARRAGAGADGGAAAGAAAETGRQAETTGSEKTIQLRRGGSLSLSLSVNLWELKGEDRNFVFELIDKIDAYEEGSKVEEGPKVSDDGALLLTKDDLS